MHRWRRPASASTCCCPKIGAPSSVTSWVRGVVAALRRELGLTLRAVIAAPLAGLAGAAAARAEVDRVFDSADVIPARSDRSRRSTKRAPRCCSTRSCRRWPAGRGWSTRGCGNCETGSDAGRHAARLSRRVRRHRRGGAAAARAPEHGALPRPSHREAAVDVAGRPRRPAGACAGSAGHRTRRPQTRAGASHSAPATSSSNRSMASSPSASRPRSGPRSAR